jgi:hypothetical protein
MRGVTFVFAVATVMLSLLAGDYWAALAFAGWRSPRSERRAALPRVVPLVKPGILPRRTLALLDTRENMLLVDRDLYNQLDRWDRGQVWRTMAPTISR